MSANHEVAVEESLLVRCTPQDAFDLITDPDRALLVTTSVRSVEPLDPLAVGARIRIRAGFLGMERDGLFEVVAYNPPNEYTYRSHGVPFLTNPDAWFESSWRMRPTASGTELSLITTMDFGRDFGPLAARALTAFVRRESARGLRRMQALLEQGMDDRT